MGAASTPAQGKGQGTVQPTQPQPTVQPTIPFEGTGGGLGIGGVAGKGNAPVQSTQPAIPAQGGKFPSAPMQPTQTAPVYPTIGSTLPGGTTVTQEGVDQAKLMNANKGLGAVSPAVNTISSAVPGYTLPYLNALQNQPAPVAVSAPVQPTTTALPTPTISPVQPAAPIVNNPVMKPTPLAQAFRGTIPAPTQLRNMQQRVQSAQPVAQPAAQGPLQRSSRGPVSRSVQPATLGLAGLLR